MLRVRVVPMTIAVPEKVSPSIMPITVAVFPLWVNEPLPSVPEEVSPI